MNLKFPVAIAACSLVMASFAVTNHVDRAKGVDAEGRGGPDAPFASIQYAVEQTASGGTILVAEGDYDNGYALDGDGFTNRVFISQKSLTIRATGAKAKTRIIGAKDLFDPYGNGTGIGPAAIRCVRTSLAGGNIVIIEGFTITGGACFSNENASKGFAGGVYASGNTTYVVGCDITDTSGQRGAAGYYGTFVRCFFADNTAPTKGAVSYRGNLLNCVAVRNSSPSGYQVVQSVVVNSTFEDNQGSIASETGTRLLNCLCLRYTGTAGDRTNTTAGNVIASNSVFNTVSTSKIACSIHEDSGDNITNAPIYQCLAPLFDDYRLVSDSVAIGYGRAEHIAKIAVPDGIDAYVDFAGNPIAKTGAVNAGAFQTTVTPAGGLVTVTTPIAPLGRKVGPNYNVYAFAEAYPTQWHVQAAAPSGSKYFYGMTMDGVKNGIRFPEMDDTLWIMPPPAGTTVSCDAKYTDYALWVDPREGRGSDESLAGEERGTESAPFHTLQAAVDAAPKSKRSIIFAAEGTYDEGGAESNSHSNRVALLSDKSIRLKGAGAGKSIIVGASDTTSDDHGEDGRGATAMRCAYVGTGVLQGFTLTGGRSAWLSGTKDDKAATRGGGVLMATEGTVSDCVITNCIAYRGGACIYGHAFRTHVIDCQSGNGVTRYTSFYSCLLDRCVNSTQPTAGGGVHLYQSTAVGTSSSSALAADSTTTADNSIMCKGTTLDSILTLEGNVAWAFSTYRATSGYVKADPLFVDAEAGDYRVLSCSPALHAVEDISNLWTYYSSDFESRPLLFVDGKPMAGAFQNPVQAVLVAAPSFAALNVGPTNVVEAGESLTVTASDTTRHALDLIVDGESAGGTTWTYTAPTDAGYPTGPVSVEAVYSTNWYVNANAKLGDEKGDGFTPETAKRTFAGLFESADVRRGDCVHAAEGRYDDKTMAGGSSNLRSRLNIPSGVSVVADGDVEKTFIVGEPSDGEHGPVDSYGRGTNAVRCVYMGSDSYLRGFTVTGGRTCGDGTSNPDNNGAGIYSGSNASTLAEDCIVSNNFACRGGGAHLGSYRRCRFFWNYAKNNRAALSQVYAYNCVVDHNRGVNAAQNCSAMVNCTFGADNLKEDGVTETPGYSMPYAVGSPVNCVFMGKYEGTKDNPFVAHNCAFFVHNTSAVYSFTNCTFVSSVAEFGLDGEYRPIVGSPVIDAGTNELYAAVAEKAGDADAGNGQRTYNRTIDIGAYEYDWRANYAAAIGEGVTVEAASPDVKLVDGKVDLADGATVSGTWSATQAGRRTTCTAVLTATDGTLAGTLGETEVSVTDTTDSRTFKVRDFNLGFELGFAGDGHGTIDGFSQMVPGALLFIR